MGTQVEATRFVDIPFREYLTDTSHSSSQLKQALRSKEHFEYARSQDPLDGRETPALLIGRALHCRVLTPHLWGEEVVVWKEGKSRNSNAYRQFRDDHPGVDILLESEEALIDKMDWAVHNSPIASKCTTQAHHKERSVFWSRGFDGYGDLNMRCKARCDAIVEVGESDCFVVDLKTCTSASPHRAGGDQPFGAAVYNYGYHLQAAHYVEGVKAATGMNVTGFVIVAVEKTPPYIVRVYNLGDAWLEHGRKALAQAWETVISDDKSLSTSIQTLPIPGWV
jgi:hypothetical protein